MSMSQIEISNVSLRLPLYGSKQRSIRNHFVQAIRGKRNRIQYHQALKDINLSLSSDSKLALIGSNGAGKSTLLRVMAGIYQPSEGTVKTTGEIATIFDLGLGFNPQSTGVENIKLVGLMRG